MTEFQENESVAETTVEHACGIKSCSSSHPSSIVVTNLSPNFFENSISKDEFERSFQSFDVLAVFIYLPSFGRVRVNFTSMETACRARTSLTDSIIAGCTIKCYFIQMCGVSGGSNCDDDGLLHPPAPTKQYLISPPSSPPDDWLQAIEARPAVDASLLATVARMTPGEHELHSNLSCDNQPQIVLHVAAADPSTPSQQNQRPTIQHTRRPDAP